MGKGRALVVAVSQPRYSGFAYLRAVKNDYQAMMDVFRKKFGYATKGLLDSEGTAGAVLDGIDEASAELRSGDQFVLYYSGHGTTKPGHGGEESEDELWVTYDETLVDDKLGERWSKFKAGVRIVVMTDSCNSGTAVRAANDGGPRPLSIGLKSQSRAPSDRAGNNDGINASLIHLAAGRDDQTVVEVGNHGVFTDELLRGLSAGLESYGKLYSQIAARASARNPGQTAQLTTYGAYQKTFLLQKPFVAAQKWPPFVTEV